MTNIKKLLVLAALTGACAPSSDNATEIGNSDGTGIPVGSMVDIDNDGKADGVALDTDGDGKSDSIDTNGDGMPDGPLPAGTMVVGEGGGDNGGQNGGQAGNNNSNEPVDPNDRDNDGFTMAEGDCEDGSPDINPGAFDFPGNEFDEDCDGTVAMTPAEAGTGCDESLAIDSTDPMDAARAIGLCKTTTMDSVAWGVIEAKFTTADGTGMNEDGKMVGILPEFGAAKVRAGSSLLALSSGIARAPGQADYTEECDSFTASPDPADLLCILLGNCGPMAGEQTAPAGFPKASTTCTQQDVGGPDTPAFNGVGLELKIRVPTNAKSFAFDSIFYTYEFPSFLCQSFNDFFIATKEPLPEFVPDGNVLFDSNGDPVGVNTGLLSVCDQSAVPSPAPKPVNCSQGTGLLAGTGFGAGEAQCNQPADAGGASTGWLNTTVPTAPAEVITLRFSIWDAGDAILDSTALVDNFVWSVNDPEVATTPIVF